MEFVSFTQQTLSLLLPFVYQVDPHSESLAASRLLSQPILCEFS